MREKTVPVVEEIYWAAGTPETEKTTVLALIKNRTTVRGIAELCTMQCKKG